MNNEPNGLNINTDCGSTHIEHLQKFVTDEKCDLGFAYDGDADRCIAVDKNGRVVDGDSIMYICGKYMKEQEVCSIIRWSPPSCPISDYIRHLTGKVLPM